MGFLPLVIAAALSAAQPLTVPVSGSGYVQLAAAAAGTFRVTIANSKPSNCANDAKARRRCWSYNCDRALSCMFI